VARNHSPSIPAATRRRLLAAARRARRAAYAPYSKFRVGAALLASDGRVFEGCNVENSSSASSLCAEQVALVRAVAEGARRFDAVLILTGARTPTAPCGRCRQAMAEFRADLPVLLATTSGKSRDLGLDALLPHPFRR
jgi:cytidine deaminase